MHTVEVLLTFQRICNREYLLLEFVSVPAKEKSKTTVGFVTFAMREDCQSALKTPLYLGKGDGHLCMYVIHIILQCCGSGSISGSGLDPDSVKSLDPDPGGQK